MSSRPPITDPVEPPDDGRTLFPHEVQADAGDATSASDDSARTTKDPVLEPPFGLPEDERYENLGVLAVGGMGVIQNVVDRRLGRRVVRKVAHEGHPQLESRLAREAWVIAQLDHPGIVQALDAGELPNGRGYYTMPLVEGSSLQTRLDESADRSDRRPLLRAVRDACEAVGYAHREGFVHRDLKPDNIMVGSFGDTRVMDWGLARPAPGAAGNRWRGHFPPQQEALTHVGAVLGTPAYMSPEQARGEEAHPTADVWSLGTILFEVVSGRRLFVGDDARTVMTAVIRGADETLDDSRASMPGPLHAIISRALAHDPADRFPDAKALADDLTRWLESRVVESHRYTPTERLGTFLTRWRIPVTVALVTALLGVLGMAAFAWNAQQESETARKAQGEAEFAKKVSDFERLKGERYLQDALVSQIRAAVKRNDRVTGEVLAAKALRIGVDPTAMGALLTWAGQPAPERIYKAHDPAIGALQSLSEDGSWLITRDQDELQLWQTEPLQMVWSRNFPTVVAGTVSNLGDVAIRTAKETLRVDRTGATQRYSRGQTGRVVIDPFSDGVFEYHRELRELVPDEEGLLASTLLTDCADYVTFTPDGWWTACETGIKHQSNGTLRSFPFPEELSGDAPATLDATDTALLLGTVHSKVARIDARSGHTVWHRSFPHSVVGKVRASPSTGHVVAVFADGVIEILDFGTGQTLLSIPASLVGTRSISLSDDAVLTVSGLTGIQRFQLDPSLRRRTWDLPSGVTDFEFSSSAEGLFVAAGPTVLHLEWPTGRERERHRFSSIIKKLSLTSDGTLLVGTSQAEPGTAAAVFARTSPGTWQPHGADPPSYVRRMSVLGDAVLVGGWGSSGPRYIPAQEGATRWVIADPKSEPHSMTNTPDARRAAWGSGSGIWVMDADNNAPRLIGGVEDAYVLSLSIDGTLGLVERQHETLLIDLETGDIRWRETRTGAWPTTNAIDPESRFAATGLQDGSVLVRDIESGALRAHLNAHQQLVGGVAFSPDGTTLITGGWDDQIQLWDLTPLTQPLEVQLQQIDKRWAVDPSTVLRALR